MSALSFPADFTAEDWAAIRTGVEQWLAWFATGEKQFYADVRVDDVMAALQSGDMHMVMVGGYLLVYAIGSPWYAPHKVILEEQTVFRVSPTPQSFRVIPQTLLRIAAAIPNCTGIAVGTSFTRDDRLRRVYQRYGFNVEAEQLFRSL